MRVAISRPGARKRGSTPALESGARVGGERELLPGAGDVRGSKIGAFDQDVGGGFGHARMLAAHDAADVVHAASSAITVIVSSSV
jgi:hypothetical protein